jgi:hypothetical protein
MLVKLQLLINKQYLSFRKKNKREIALTILFAKKKNLGFLEAPVLWRPRGDCPRSLPLKSGPGPWASYPVSSPPGISKVIALVQPVYHDGLDHYWDSPPWAGSHTELGHVRGTPPLPKNPIYPPPPWPCLRWVGNLSDSTFSYQMTQASEGPLLCQPIWRSKYIYFPSHHDLLGRHWDCPHTGLGNPRGHPPLGKTSRILPSILLQTGVDTPAALQTWSFPSLLALWDRALAFSALGALPPRPHLSCITPSSGLSKSIALPLLRLDATGLQSSRVRTSGASHPRDCHPEAWPNRELGHLQLLQTIGNPPRVSPKASSRLGLPLMKLYHPSISPACIITRVKPSAHTVPGALSHEPPLPSLGHQAWTPLCVHPSCCNSVNLANCWTTLLQQCEQRSLWDHIIATVWIEAIVSHCCNCDLGSHFIQDPEYHYYLWCVFVAFEIPLVVLLTWCGVKNTFEIALYSKEYTFPILFRYCLEHFSTWWIL